MERKLIKTYLSRRPSKESLVTGVLGLFTLLLFFSFKRDLFTANALLVFEKKEYWRAFTTTLLHADLTHLSHNAFFFTGLATLLHSYFGFWVFPVISLIVGGIINLITLSFYPPHIHLVGISGVIYFMASFWLMLYLLIERRQKLSIRIIHAIAVSLIFFFPETIEPQVSYLAHGMGFILGIPVGLSYYMLNRRKLRAEDQWLEIEDTIEEENYYHLESPEEDGPSQRASDSSRSQLH
jgi:rhomboid protease GluP